MKNSQPSSAVPGAGLTRAAIVAKAKNGDAKTVWSMGNYGQIIGNISPAADMFTGHDSGVVDVTDELKAIAEMMLGSAYSIGISGDPHEQIILGHGFYILHIHQQATTPIVHCSCRL